MGQEMGQKEIEREMMEESGKKMEQKEKVEQDEERIMGYRISDVVSCIGKQEDDYIRRFRKLREKRRTFNICAALFGYHWLVYRLMVVEAVVLIVVDLVAEIFLPALLLGGMGYSGGAVVLGGVCTLLVVVVQFVVMGLYGDQIYWWHIKGLMDSFQCRDKGKDSQTQSELRRLGGASVPMVLFCIVLTVMIRKACKILVARWLLGI